MANAHQLRPKRENEMKNKNNTTRSILETIQSVQRNHFLNIKKKKVEKMNDKMIGTRKK